jgi:hypothetical protein
MAWIFCCTSASRPALCSTHTSGVRTETWSHPNTLPRPLVGSLGGLMVTKLRCWGEWRPGGGQGTGSAQGVEGPGAGDRAAPTPRPGQPPPDCLGCRPLRPRRPRRRPLTERSSYSGKKLRRMRKPTRHAAPMSELTIWGRTKGGGGDCWAEAAEQHGAQAGACTWVPKPTRKPPGSRPPGLRRPLGARSHPALPLGKAGGPHQRREHAAEVVLVVDVILVKLDAAGTSRGGERQAGQAAWAPWRRRRMRAGRRARPAGPGRPRPRGARPQRVRRGVPPSSSHAQRAVLGLHRGGKGRPVAAASAAGAAGVAPPPAPRPLTGRLAARPRGRVPVARPPGSALDRGTPRWGGAGAARGCGHPATVQSQLKPQPLVATRCGTLRKRFHGPGGRRSGGGGQRLRERDDRRQEARTRDRPSAPAATLLPRACRRRHPPPAARRPTRAAAAAAAAPPPPRLLRRLHPHVWTRSRSSSAASRP